jgi:PAS domain S-box-containing protein
MINPTDPSGGPLRVSVDNLLEGVQIIDRGWRYVYVNPAAARHGQRAADELVGRTMMECYPGIERTELFRALERVIATGQREAFANEFTFPSGDKRWFDLVIGPVPDGICILSLDVTDLRRTELELHHAQRLDAIGQLAGGIAHDFNNQLTLIQGVAQLLLDVEEDDSVRADLQAICSAVERSAALTVRLVAFSRRQVLRVEPIDLNQVVRNLETLFRRVLRADIVLDLQFHREPTVITGDAQKLENALTNLAVNASDAMPNGGRLTIATTVTELTDEDALQHPTMSKGRYAVLTVSDTGQGMDAATRAQIFQPFFTTKPAGKGTGLGLPMVYGTVKQMGGFIWVYSEMGSGTSFRLYFPTTSEIPQDRPREIPEGRPRPGASVLVVDDNDGIRELVVRALSRHGYYVEAAGDVDEARDRMRTMGSLPDLLLADIVMPGASGVDLAREIGEGKTRVLFMSGYSQHAIPDVVAVGGLLEKPFTVNELLRAVEQALM